MVKDVLEEHKKSEWGGQFRTEGVLNNENIIPIMLLMDTLIKE